jgi:hypothetical protein
MLFFKGWRAGGGKRVFRQLLIRLRGAPPGQLLDFLMRVESVVSAVLKSSIGSFPSPILGQFQARDEAGAGVMVFLKRP